MRPITWLQVSDFHLREHQAWSQDVVLSAMCEDIGRRRNAVGGIDFILATGDLAFAGKPSEYELAATFFDKLSTVSGVPSERIFCIPGNHDVDRDLQRMCFIGVRHALQSQNDIDSFLSSGEELETLLRRQEGYRRFQEAYFAGQEKVWTPDRLGYVSIVTIEDVRIAIVGLNSAWLAEGGLSDHGRLLLGERQVIDALGIAKQADPHLIIAMGHHPFDLLNDFDRRPVRRRIEEKCHFFHCGHLHDPEARDAVRSGTHCLTVAAGASFESRHTPNTYSLITLDVMQARRAVKTVQYKPTDGAFSYELGESFPFLINAAGLCGIGELAHAIEAYNASLSPLAHYLSALLLEAQSEIVITTGNSCAFGSLDLLCDQPDSDLKATTIAFMAVRNPLKLFAGRMSLTDFLCRHGEAVLRYGAMLNDLCASDVSLRERLAGREGDARALAGSEPLQPFAHTLALISELAAEQDWELLREQAERHLDSPERVVAIQARRMLALCLAQPGERHDRVRAAEMYRALIDEGPAEAGDFVALASLLADSGHYPEAMKVVLSGIDRFPASADGYFVIGQTIVQATGDRAFRDELAARKAGRRTA